MVCQAFACTPLEAMQQPYPLVVEIMEARAFAAAHEATRTYKGDEGEPEPAGELVDIVNDFTREDVMAAVARHKEKLETT